MSGMLLAGVPPPCSALLRQSRVTEQLSPQRAVQALVLDLLLPPTQGPSILCTSWPQKPLNWHIRQAVMPRMQTRKWTLMVVNWTGCSLSF